VVLIDPDRKADVFFPSVGTPTSKDSRKKRIEQGKKLAELTRKIPKSGLKRI